MERVRDNLAETRAHTDASLDAERASSDDATARKAPKAQRVLDDLIERDRLLADDRLWKFRDRADNVLARQRFASPARDSSARNERRVADESKQAEREATDAVLGGERRRTDAAAKTERRAHAADRVRLEARRQETDDQLSTERSGADVAATTLHQTKNALADAQGAQARGHDVLGMVTHDLRSPLYVIALNAQSIVQDTKEASTLEAAQDVTRAAARMERLLTDLLDVARIESGTLRITKRQHDVGVLMSELRQSYEPLFADRDMVFTVTGPADVTLASFDYDRIVQVLSNLLGNAMKFTPPKGIVELQVEARDGEIEFALCNTGPGIHPAVLPHVFERFWQIDSDNRRGLGLGLHICDKIVEAHAGRIWVESKFGEGATFRFTLPANPAAFV